MELTFLESRQHRYFFNDIKAHAGTMHLAIVEYGITKPYCKKHADVWLREFPASVSK
jgi:hypothetical protein